MNELSAISSKKNQSINNILPLFLLLFLSKGSFGSNSIMSRDELGRITLVDLPLEKIEKGITIAKKVGPYLPESVITLLNVFIPSIEKMTRVVAILDFISNNKSFQPIVSVNTENKKDMVSAIINSLKDEIPQDKMKDVGPMLELITNIDKYKSIMEIFTNLSKPSEKTGKGQMDQIIDVMLPLVSGSDPKNKDKMKDLIQMMEIVKLLGTESKKKKEDEGIDIDTEDKE